MDINNASSESIAENDTLNKFKLTIQKYLWFSVLILLSTFIYIYVKYDIASRQICINTNCIDNYFSYFRVLVDIFEFLLKTLLTGVTIFSFYYALKNYINTTNAAVVNIHLTNLNTFKDYLASESLDMKALNIKNIDTLKWYNKIYPNSREGNLNISTKYHELILEINKVIDSSNNTYMGLTDKSTFFNHKLHQTEMIKVLKKLGIKIGRTPRNNFKDAEDVIFEIINKVNKEFCGSKGPRLIQKQKYN